MHFPTTTVSDHRHPPLSAFRPPEATDGIFVVDSNDTDHPARQLFYKSCADMFVRQKGWEESPEAEHDEWYRHSDIVVEVRGGEVKCGCRLIKRELAGTLPCEPYLASSVHPMAIEISRFHSICQGIGTVRSVFRLFRTMSDNFVANEVPQIVMVINQNLLRKLQTVGLDIFEPLKGAEKQKPDAIFLPHEINLDLMRKAFPS